MKFRIIYEQNGQTFPLLNDTIITAKSAAGLKRALINAIRKKMHVLGIWYGHGSRLSVTAKNIDTDIIAATTEITVF